MENLLVLGLIPGTSIQITFEMWAIPASFILSAVVVRLLHMDYYARVYMILVAVMTLSLRHPRQLV